MGYSINVSKADQNKDGSIKLGWDKKPSYAHYFATASRSIGYTSSKAKKIAEELATLYPSPLYKITISRKETRYDDVDINNL